ncbi:hypothetical protein R1sor_020480 [Riccia sorocarpa]|uniref:Glycosyltransferases n=1 Tax=Riccia sorocarpa TaxID=122646 RepID=A0ABD3IFG5_9MARC
MGRALRRTLSGNVQQQSRRSYSSLNGGVRNEIVTPDGGGGNVVLTPGTSELHNYQHHQGSHISSPTSVLSAVTGRGRMPESFQSMRSFLSEALYIVPRLLFILPFYCGRSVARSGSMEKQLKPKGTLYKKPLVQLLICFILGVLLGCAPLGWVGSLGERVSARQKLAVEVNSFMSRSQSGQRLLDVDPGEGSEVEQTVRLSVEDDGTDSSESWTTEEESFLQIAPGLNYSFDPERKLIIVVTPTYNRALQAHFLTRLAHTLRLVPPPLLWLVVEHPWASYETAAFLRRTGIMYRHLICRENVTNSRERAAYQRNRALLHIEMHRLDGIVYFADDDNIYSVEVFEELRKIKRFGIWPVAMVGENRAKTMIEGPVCDGDKVIGWQTNEKSKRVRRFHIHMPGFGFNSTMLWNRTVWPRPTLEPIRQLPNKEGLVETTFIEQLVEDESQMEGLPSGCSKIMVWHLQMDTLDLFYPAGWTLQANLKNNTPLRP